MERVAVSFNSLRELELFLLKKVFGKIRERKKTDPMFQFPTGIRVISTCTILSVIQS